MACRAKFRQTDFAMEITQEAFARAFSSMDTLRDEAKFQSWVTAIAINFGNKKGRSDQSSYNALPPGDMLERGWNQVAPEDIHIDDVNFIRRWILALPAQDQPAFLMKYYYGMMDKDISEQTGKPLGTVKRRLHNLRTKLAQAIGGEFPK